MSILARMAPMNLNPRKSLEIKEPLLGFMGSLQSRPQLNWDHEPRICKSLDMR